MNARDTVLHGIRGALAGSTPPATVPREYAVGDPTLDVVETFVERVRAYRATVVVTVDAREAARDALRAEDARRVGTARDLPGELRPDGVELIADDALSPHELDAIDGALTTCRAACAVTGTIALDGGPGQGRRALSLLPDLHVCVVRSDQIVATVPELVRVLRASAAEGRPIVLVSGPSATSDIELERVEGVHGPRRLVVIVEQR